MFTFLKKNLGRLDIEISKRMFMTAQASRCTYIIENSIFLTGSKDEITQFTTEFHSDRSKKTKKRNEKKGGGGVESGPR